MIYLPAARARNRNRSWRTPSEAPRGRRARTRFLPALIGRLLRERRASASIELAIGTVAILAVAAVAFDLYSLTRANAAGERAAATMADYVSRESEPDGGEMAALGKFLHEQEFGMPSALVYVISAVHEPPGDGKAVKLWDYHEIRFGKAEDTAALVQECQHRGKSGWRAALLGDGATLTLKDNGVVIVVEVCASLLREGMLSETMAGNLYRVHALPARATAGTPEKPTSSSTSEDAAVSSGDGTAAVAVLHEQSGPSLRRAASESELSSALVEVA